MSRSLVSLRQAVRADAPLLAELWSEVLRRGTPEDRVADVESLIGRAAQAPGHRLLVAEYDGEFAGAVYLEATTITPVNLEPAVRAVSPHVVPRLRRHGVGRALMEAAVAFAEELGIGHIESAAGSGSRDANRFMARIALGPYAVLRVASTHVVRSRLTAQRRTVQPANGRQLTQVIAARRSMRRSARASMVGELKS